MVQYLKKVIYQEFQGLYSLKLNKKSFTKLSISSF